MARASTFAARPAQSHHETTWPVYPKPQIIFWRGLGRNPWYNVTSNAEVFSSLSFEHLKLRSLKAVYGYSSARQPPLLKTYLSAACNVTLMHKCAALPLLVTY